MSSDYDVWVRRMYEQRQADQSEQERRQLALRAQAERDQAIGVAMRQQEYEGNLLAQRNQIIAQYIGQHNQADAQYLAQLNFADLQYAVQKLQEERNLAVRKKRAREARRTAQFQADLAHMEEMRKAHSNQRCNEYVSAHRGAVARNALRRPAAVFLPMAGVGALGAPGPRQSWLPVAAR